MWGGVKGGGGGKAIGAKKRGGAKEKNFLEGWRYLEKKTKTTEGERR